MNPFEYANDLMKKKDYDGDCIRERKDYKPFFINRSFALFRSSKLSTLNEI